MRKRALLAALVVLAFTVLSQPAMACPVCFGDTDSKIAEGVNAAIMVLMGITGSLMGLFGVVFLKIRKRMKLTLNGTIDYPRMN